MRGSRSSPFSGGQVQLAKRYEDVLRTIYEEYAEPFKIRDVMAEFPAVGQGDFLKLKRSGLLRNEFAGSDDPKDWYLERKTKRWLRSRR